MLDANLFSECHVRTGSLQVRTLFDDANSTYALELGTISHAVVLANSSYLVYVQPAFARLDSVVLVIGF